MSVLQVGQVAVDCCSGDHGVSALVFEWAVGAQTLRQQPPTCRASCPEAVPPAAASHSTSSSYLASVCVCRRYFLLFLISSAKKKKEETLERETEKKFHRKIPDAFRPKRENRKQIESQSISRFIGRISKISDHRLLFAC